MHVGRNIYTYDLNTEEYINFLFINSITILTFVFLNNRVNPNMIKIILTKKIKDKATSPRLKKKSNAPPSCKSFIAYLISGESSNLKNETPFINIKTSFILQGM